MLTALFSVAYAAPLTTSSIVRDRVQLTTYRSSTVASPSSLVPISRCRRSTLPTSQSRLRSSAHVPVSAVSLRSSSCCTDQACSHCSSSRHSLTNSPQCWSSLHLTLHLCVVSCLLISRYFVDIVSYRFPLGPYRANTSFLLPRISVKLKQRCQMQLGYTLHPERISINLWLR